MQSSIDTANEGLKQVDERIEALRKTCKEDLTTEVARLEGGIKVEGEATRETIQASSEQIKSMQSSIDTVNEGLKQADERIEALSALSDKVSSYQEQLKTLDTLRSQINYQGRGLETLRTEVKSTEQRVKSLEVLSSLVNSHEKQLGLLDTLHSQTRSHDKQLLLIENLPDRMLSCEKQLVLIEALEFKLSGHESQLNHLDSLYSRLSGYDKQIELLETRCNEYEGYKRHLVTLQALEVEVQKHNSHLDEIDQSITALKDPVQAKKESRALAKEDMSVYLQSMPIRIYSYKCNTGELYWTSLETGANSFAKLPLHTFRNCSSWCELPGGLLAFTGGQDITYYKECTLVNINDLSIEQKAPMIGARGSHNSAYFRGALYAIGGYRNALLKSCERYLCDQDVWEEIPELLVASHSAGLIVLDITARLYALGGIGEIGTLDVIQELDLRTLTWRELLLHLPNANYLLACFKLNSDAEEIYFMESKYLYCINPSRGRFEKLWKLDKNHCSCWGPSYFYNNVLYSSSNQGAVTRVEIGKIR